MRIKVFFFLIFLFLIFCSPARAQVWTDLSPDWPMATKVAASMAVHGDRFYVGTFNQKGVAQVWQYDGTSWTNLSPGWAGNRVSASSMVVYQENLYVGTEGLSGGAQVWQYDGTSWTDLSPGWTRPNSVAISMAVYGDNLYVGTYNNEGAEVWRYNGTAWTDVSPGWTAGNRSASSMAVYGDNLYVGTYNHGGAQVWQYDGATWLEVLPGWTGAIKSAGTMAVYGDNLYVGTGRGSTSTGAQIWRYDGTSWTEVSPGWTNQNTAAYVTVVYGDNLYIGTGHNSAGAQLWRYNGIAWTEVSPGWPSKDSAARALAVYKDNLYLGTYNPRGAGVWQLSQQPAEKGTLGTEFTITGSGFGTTQGSVRLSHATGRTEKSGNTALKILEWTDASILCSIPKALPPGPYTVTVDPSKGSPITLEDNFVIEAPQIESVAPAMGSAGDEVTITGLFFGTKKGKVAINATNNNKTSCTVLTWTMDPPTGESEIRFEVPKGISPGSYQLKVSNGVGASSTTFTIE